MAENKQVNLLPFFPFQIAYVSIIRMQENSNIDKLYYLVVYMFVCLLVSTDKLIINMFVSYKYLFYISFKKNHLFYSNFTDNNKKPNMYLFSFSSSSSVSFFFLFSLSLFFVSIKSVLYHVTNRKRKKN